MTQQYRYDLTKSPPGPVLPVRIGATSERGDAAVAAVVDTGADISLIPARLAKELKLPVLGELMVRGVTGSSRVWIYGVELEVAGMSVPIEAAGLGETTLLGRDVINRWTLVLRGPEQLLELERPSSDDG